MRIATWNVNSITARLPRLLAWLESSGTDVLCLQETKCTLEQFPAEALREAGYESAVNATGRWNGVALLSRVGLADVVTGLPDGPDYEGVQEPRAVSATCGPARVWSVYVPNGREVSHDHYAYKLRWLEALQKAVAADAAGTLPFAVLGDFNIAPTDDDVWDPSLFVGATHVTPAERAALAALREEGLSDVVPRPQVRPPVHLLGLPPAQLPEEQGHAHRPGLRQRPLRGGGQGQLRRPRGAEGQGSLRPRPGGRGPRRLTTGFGVSTSG